jgi:hypothetical protein
MNQPNFDYTNINNLLYHVDNMFAITFASINTTSRTAVDALYGNHIIYNIYVVPQIDSCLRLNLTLREINARSRAFHIW